MWNALAVLLVAVGVFTASADSLEARLAVLADPNASYADLLAAADGIAPLAEGGDANGTVSALMDIWAQNPSASIFHRHRVALLTACELANDESARDIISRVRTLAASPDRATNLRAGIFFGEPVRKLIDRVSDPEPVLRLVSECGIHGLYVLTALEVPTHLKSKYLVEACRQGIRCGSLSPPPSLVCCMTDDAIAALRAYVETAQAEAPATVKLDVPIWILVQLEDPWVVPRIEALLKQPGITEMRCQRLDMYLAKLRHQHSKEAMLTILRTEADNAALLSWATRRLLWLKVSPATVRAALERDLSQRAAARRLLNDVFEAPSAHRPSTNTNTWFLSKEELVEWCSQREQLNASQARPASYLELSTRALLERAKQAQAD